MNSKRIFGGTTVVLILLFGSACASAAPAPFPTGAPPAATVSLAVTPPNSPVPVLTAQSVPTVTATLPTLVSTPTPVASLGCQQDTTAFITRIIAQTRIAEFQTPPSLTGTAFVYGTANQPNMASSKVEFSADNRKSWTIIGSPLNGPINDAAYGTWQTQNFPDGEYWLRLLVVDKTGNYKDPACPIRVILKNGASAGIPPSADCSDPDARITAPKSDQVVSGSVNIFGTANRNNFSYFEVQFSSDRKAWTSLRRSVQPALDTLLFFWNTRTVPNGEYWLRVLVVDKSGNYNQPCELHLTVKN